MKQKKNSWLESEPEELEETDETEDDFDDEEKPPKKGLFSRLVGSLFEEVDDDEDDEDEEDDDSIDDDDEYEEDEEDYDDEEEEIDSHTNESEEDTGFDDFSENSVEEEQDTPVFVFPDENETNHVVMLNEESSDIQEPVAPDELLLDAPEDMPAFREEAVPDYQNQQDTESVSEITLTDKPDFSESPVSSDTDEEENEEDDEEEEENEEEQPKKGFLSVAIPIMAVLVIALGFTYCLQLGLFDEKEVYYMPDFVGRNYYELGEDYNNFDIQVNRSDYSAYDKDVIYAQDIPAGTEVKLGQTVKIDLSLGYAVVQVPDVRNYQFAYAQKLLEQSGFETEIVYEQSLNGTAADNVIRTLPASGEEANEGSKITMYVSQGLAADSAQVQTFTGMLLDDAVDLCEMYGLEVETVPVPALDAPNVVVEQSIAAGTNVPFHTIITLAYSSGEQPQGSVPYQLNFPPYSSGRFILDFIDKEGTVLASSDIIVAGFSAASIVPVQGTGSQEIKVVLNNCTTNLQAELGTYNFDFTTGTYTILNEDMQAAFVAVKGVES